MPNPADSKSSMTSSASVTMPFVWSFLTCQTQAEPFEEWMRKNHLTGGQLFTPKGKLCGGPHSPERLMAGEMKQQQQRHGADLCGRRC